MSALKDILIPYSCRAEIVENQAKHLILQMAELQHKLNSQLHRVCTVKNVDWKKLDAENQNCVVLEDPEGAEQIEPPNSDEASLPVEAISPPPSRTDLPTFSTLI